MTPQQFKAWRKRLGLSQLAAGKALGISISTVILYEHGKRYEANRDYRPVVIPKTVRLAMIAVAAGLKDEG